MPVRALLGLLLCNVLWSGTFAISKNLMNHFTPLEVAFLRYFTGAVPLTVYCFLKKAKSGRSLFGEWLAELKPVDLRLIVVGLLTFFLSPYLQMKGLSQTRAIDSTLMISIEPLFTILAACLLLGERVRWRQLAVIVMAMAGAGILTELSWSKLMTFSDARLLGNLTVLASMFSEAAFSVVAKPALEHRSPVLFVSVALLVGTTALFLCNVSLDGPARLSGLVPLVQAGRLADFVSVAYLGWACTLFGYLYWMIVLTDTPLSIMALTLYVQPILGMVWGHFLLNESLNVYTFAGGSLILAALWLGSQPSLKSRARAEITC